LFVSALQGSLAAGSAAGVIYDAAGPGGTLRWLRPSRPVDHSPCWAPARRAEWWPGRRGHQLSVGRLRRSAADLADFFRRALESPRARGYYVVGDGINSTVAELTQAAAVAVCAPGAVPGSDEEARARLGDYFAEVLLLDQGTVAAKARTELDWNPSHPALVEFRQGSYRT
jgi:hypothetical protein